MSKTARVIWFLLQLALLAAGLAILWQQDLALRTSLRQQQQALQAQALQVANLQRRLAQRSVWEENLSQDHRRLSLWKQQEIAFDLHLAERELRLDRNPGEAQALLQSAIELAQGEESPDWLPLRAALAEDELALKNTPHSDLPALYLRLQALSHLLADLQLPLPVAHLEVPALSHPAAAATLSGRWAAGWQAFMDLIRVHHEPTLQLPLPSALEVRELSLLLQTQLQSAAWALLHGQGSIYQQSLLACDQELSRHALLLHPQTLGVARQELQALLQAYPGAPLPDLQASLKALQQLQGVAP